MATAEGPRPRRRRAPAPPVLFPLLLMIFVAPAFRASAQAAPKKVEKPCENGVVQNGHAYSKCIGGFWHVVSEVEYSCPDGSREVVTTTEKTGQACAEKFNLFVHLQGPCQAPVPAGEHVVRKCVQGFWEEEVYSQFRCLDGSLRVIGPPIRSTRTNQPCEEKEEKTTPQAREHHAAQPEPGAKPGGEEKPKTEKPATPPPPAPSKTTPPPPPPPPSASPSSAGSTYMCGKSVCDCRKQSPPKVCKAGSGCACTKG